MGHVRINRKRPFLEQLAVLDIELDQRMKSALEMRPYNNLSDDDLLFALYQLNSIVTRHLELKESHVWPAYTDPTLNISPKERVPVEQIRITANNASRKVFDRALEFVGDGKTFGVYHFVKAVVELSIKYGDSYAHRPYSVDMLCRALGLSERFPISSEHRLIELLKALDLSVDGAEDFQYLVALENERIVFRVTSILGDYIQPSDSGIVLGQRAILTHFKDQFGGFTQDEIEELEELINNLKSQENDFQGFFERYPHFFRKWDYREVYPHVYLTKSPHSLIPDFILTDKQLQRAAIVELKLPKPKLIRRQRNRDRFSEAVMEARAQLLRYREWFRNPYNRQQLKQIVGMEIYEPQLAVIIGRAKEFEDEFDRQSLVAENRDIEIVTYDDILTYAERRRIIITPNT